MQSVVDKLTPNSKKTSTETSERDKLAASTIVDPSRLDKVAIITSVQSFEPLS